MARLQSQRKSKRWQRTGLGGAVLALLGAFLIVQQAVALSGSTFEVLDGNESVEDATKIDWASDEVVGGLTELPDESQTPTDESISGSEDDTVVQITAGGIQPNKSDIVRVRKFAKKEGGKDFLYLAFDRYPTTNGVMAIDFELNQKSQGAVPANGGTWTLNRTAGDKLLVFEMVNGGSVPIISMMSWVTGATDDCEKNGQAVPCWGTKKLLSPETNPAAEGSVNQTGDIVFGEMAVSLQDAGVFKANECTSFASLYAKSRSSGSSLSNQISDLVKPKETTVTNCGSVTVEKRVAGPTVSGDPTTFAFTVSCPGADLDPVTAGKQQSIGFSLAHNGSRKVNDVPVGSNCTVTETSPSPDNFTTTYQVTGAATASAGREVTLSNVPLAGKTVTFTNTRNTAGLSVTKAVVGGAGGESFAFTASCSGHSLAAADAAFNLGAGGTKSISGIPVGTSCTVTETDPGSNWSTTRSIDGGTATSGRAATVTMVAGGKSVAFTNTRNTGALSVTKATSGGTGTFSFTAACTGHTLAAGDAAFALAGGGTKSISGIPTGTSCTVTELDPGSGWSTTYSVDAGTATAGRSTSAVVDGDGTTVAFTNTRNTGGLTVSKAVAGPTNAGDATSFSFTVECSGATLAAGDASFDLAGGTSKTISGIPTGTSCTVTETDPGSGWSTTRSVDAATASAGRTATTTVDADGTSAAFTNTRLTGSLAVSKAVVGPTSAADTTSFSFTASCTGFTLAGADASFALAGGESKTISGIPTGTSCTVTETDPGSGWSTTRSVDAAAVATSRTATSTVDADGTAVAFTNTRQTGTLTVTKTTTGDTGSFEFTVACVGFTLDADDASFSLSGGGTRAITSIPTGTSCTVTETDPGSRWTTTTKVDAAAATPGRSASSTVDADGTTVAMTNVRNTGSLTVEKATTGSDGTFSFEVDCAGTAFDQTVEVTTTAGSGSSSTIDGIPTETDCTVTEIVPAGWAVTGGASRTVTIDGAETVAFANRLLPSAIDVTKTPSATTVHAGDAVTYTYVVTNPGENPLGAVKVVDDKCDPVTFAGGDADGDSLLDPTESWTFRCTSELSVTTTNVATATGVDPRGQTQTATATATVVVINPRIVIVKTADASSVAPGTTVVYTYTVTNPGDVPLTAVTVADDKCSPVTFTGGDTNRDGVLQVTETWSFTCSQVQTGALDTLTNVGTAAGTDPLGRVVKSTDTLTVSVVAPLVLAQPSPPALVPAPVATAPLTLPRTGIDVNGWIQVGASLILLGVSLLVTARNRRRTA